MSLTRSFVSVKRSVPIAKQCVFGLALAFAFIAGSRLYGDITLAKIFSDNMVLQRNSSIKLWGTAEASQNLEVTFLDQKVAATADAQGNWSVRLITSAHGGPYQLEVAAIDGGAKIVLSNVMVGEVWLCSGQSNMEWPMTTVKNFGEEIASANEFGNLRLFTVAKDASPAELDDFAKVEAWQVCSGETVRDFSATAFFFGRELSRQMNGIPIGLIDSSWGGTPAEAWVSRTSLKSKPEFGPMLSYWDEKPGNDNQNRPGFLYNGMIAPLNGTKICGVIWYQGESNNGRGFQYRTLFPSLIADWRTTFANPEMPFLFVQLAPFRYGSVSPIGLPEIWDAQLHTLKSVSNTGMVVTTDIGDFKDIHPPNKQDVGLRLARIALKQVYKADSFVNRTVIGPIYRSHRVEGNKVRVKFDHAGNGLKSSDNPELTEFLICGEDRNFVPAKAVILDVEQIEVWSEQIENPVAVRFAWKDTPSPNLYNSEMLPASPFRTDDWELESAKVEF
jgi:sialate O-acetylesterase